MPGERGNGVGTGGSAVRRGTSDSMPSQKSVAQRDTCAKSQQQQQEEAQRGNIRTNNITVSNCSASKSPCGGAGSDREALVENEKLVSFLMETGSILALAQRLEEEEEWRRATPSSASSGPA